MAYGPPAIASLLGDGWSGVKRLLGLRTASRDMWAPCSAVRGASNSGQTRVVAAKYIWALIISVGMDVISQAKVAVVRAYRLGVFREGS